VTKSRASRPCLRIVVASVLAALAGGVAVVDGAGARPLALYARRESLQATLLATRARLAGWPAQQQAARAVAKLGPWHMAGPFAAPTSLDGKAIDLAAKGKDGKPLWSAHPEWKDGRLLPLPALRAPSTTAYLSRTITAQKAVTPTIGAGGGDHLKLWLNGTLLADCDTRIPWERYGTGSKADDTPRDQAIVAVPLAAGANRLLVRLDYRAGGRRNPSGLWFTLAPQPVGRVWQRVRADFPPEQNRLLEVVGAEWFGACGWLASTNTQLEQAMLGRVLADSGPAGTSLRGQRDALVRQKAPASDPRWLDLCVAAAELSTTLRDIRNLRAAVVHLFKAFPADYPGGEFLTRLHDFEQRLGSLAGERLDPQDAATRKLVADVVAAKREMLVAANPLLKGSKLLFVTRTTYNSMHYYDDYYNGLRKFGGNLCVLSLDDGTVTEVAPELSGGIFDRYDLSFDATRIVFGYRRPKPEGFRIHEIRVDGTGHRQITFPPADEAERVARYSMRPRSVLESNPLLYGHWTDDMHPCYLPDGRIVFASSRCERSVLCGGHSLTTTCLYRTQADGSGLHQLSQGALSEFCPTMLDDGRILYNRWEYVYKGIAAVQPLWAMYPDGSRSEEVYGDNITNPGVFLHGRQVPGRSDLVVCTGVGHEPLGVGTIVLLKRHTSKRSEHAMTFLTPDTKVGGLRGLIQRRNGRWRTHDVHGPFYADPYPLSDKFFLVACNPRERYNHPTAYGIHLLDAFGNRVPIYSRADISCWQPMVLRPRRTPPVLPPAEPIEVVAAPVEPKHATVVVTDVYEGLEGVPRGTVKYLRVMEQIARPWSAWQHRRDDGVPGQMVAVSWFSHIWIAVLHGTVPVAADGSAHFTVPADRNIYLQALDKDFMEVQRMRTFVNFQPGEKRSCIGCHEHRSLAPATGPGLALRHAPSRPAPQPGDSAPRPLHYPTDVQPTLDKHCVRCHSGPKPKAGINLSATPTSHFSRSYETFMSKGLVNTIREWSGPGHNGCMDHAPAVPPYTYGSHKSKLIAHLRKGHKGVKLARDEFIKLVTWIDANGPYYGSYFGRRNLRYKSRPDFRPVPTLASACGVAPDPATLRPKPIPARLVAWWRLDEQAGAVAADASGKGHDAKVVAAGWERDGRVGGALTFDGRGYVEFADLGSFEAISVALWVKAGELTNTWSPLLFRNEWEQSAFHLSLLRSGQVNVAVNAGHNAALHTTAKGSVGDGKWHHVAVVCDGRFGGAVRFYIDGRLDAERELDAGLAIVLDRGRLGAYNVWERSPANNFHGILDDVRVYRGSLTDQQVAHLATPAPPQGK